MANRWEVLPQDPGPLSIVNLSVLKNNHAKAVRFSTVKAICDALECNVGDILGVRP